MWCIWTCVKNCVLIFLTPTALVVFFLSCTPSGEAGTSPFDVLSSSRRAPSHSSLWSLSTLKAWPRLVYDTAGGTDGPTSRHTHTHENEIKKNSQTGQSSNNRNSQNNKARNKAQSPCYNSAKQSHSKQRFRHHLVCKI